MKKTLTVLAAMALVFSVSGSALAAGKGDVNGNKGGVDRGEARKIKVQERNAQRKADHDAAKAAKKP
jgi:hypothetical protein